MRKSYWLVGSRLSVIAVASETKDRYDLVEGWFPAGAAVPPHRHSRYSEHIYVLEGEFTVWIGGSDKRKAVLRPGDGIFIPIGTPHALAATSGGPARALVVASPSGFAKLISEAGTPYTGEGAPPAPSNADMDRLMRASAELGDEILGPPGAIPE